MKLTCRTPRVAVQTMGEGPSPGGVFLTLALGSDEHSFDLEAPFCVNITEISIANDFFSLARHVLQN